MVLTVGDYHVIAAGLSLVIPGAIASVIAFKKMYDDLLKKATEEEVKNLKRFIKRELDKKKTQIKRLEEIF